MPTGIIDLKSQQVLQLAKLPDPRAARAPEGKSFDQVLQQKRQAAEPPKPQDDSAPANDADASQKADKAKPDDETKAADAKKAGKKDAKAKVVSAHGDDDESSDLDSGEVAAAADSTDSQHKPADTESQPDTGDTAEPHEVKAVKHAGEGEDLTEVSPEAAAAAAATAQQTTEKPVATDAGKAAATQDDPVDVVATTTPTAAPKTTVANDAKSSATPAKKTDAGDEKDDAVLADEKTVKPAGKEQATLKLVAADGDSDDSASADAKPDAAKPAAKTIDASAPVVDPAVIAPAPAHNKAGSAVAAAQQQIALPTNDRAAVAANNVEKIVSSVKGNLGANGGTMQIRLDPPTLGQVNVSVSFENGVMTATMQTENEQATRMLSHSLSDLKTSLESAGMTVDKIQVKQAAPSEHSSNQQSGQQQSRDQSTAYNDSSRQDQQRRDMLKRMWSRVSGNLDDLDLVA